MQLLLSNDLDRHHQSSAVLVIGYGWEMKPTRGLQSKGKEVKDEAPLLAPATIPVDRQNENKKYNPR